ncbi:MAG: transposase [Actinomycetia bacterium]|nr:transposase [Actinomycetes bacterium]
MFRILYRFLASLARLSVRSDRSRDLEIIVLRHQFTVLRQQVERPSVNDDDRTLLGAIAAAPPRRLRDGWIVTPETFLRRHRRRVARHWTQPPARRDGRPPTAAEPYELVVRLASENPTWVTGASKANWSASDTASDPPPCGRSSTTPVHIPVANTFAVRWIGSIRRELLKQPRGLPRTIIWNQHQLQHLVVDDIDHYNLHRPHRSLEQRPPRPIDKPKDAPPATVTVLRTTRCDGLIHQYQNAA